MLKDANNIEYWVSLSVAERINLLGILPAEGDIMTLRQVRELREALSFSEDEHKALGFQTSAQQVTWDGSKDAPKSIEVRGTMGKLIRERLEKLSAEKKLTLDQVPLYDKFIGVE